MKARHFDRELLLLSYSGFAVSPATLITRRRLVRPDCITRPLQKPFNLPRNVDQGEKQVGILDALIKNPDMIGDVAAFASDNPQVAKAAMDFLSSGSGSGGGLESVVSALRSGGLGDAVSSWLGSGDNLAISPKDLQSTLGDDTIAKFAEQAGIGGSEASAVLAGILPQIVDKLSPDGALPDKGGLDSLLGGLIGRLT